MNVIIENNVECDSFHVNIINAIIIKIFNANIIT